MGALEITILLIVMTALAALPSASVALVVARSSMNGMASGVAVAVGIVVGDLIFVFLALFGMAALADAMGSLFLLLRVAAGAYLLCFGISLLAAKPAPYKKRTERSVSSISTSFLAGLLLTLGDVKAILFYASLFPAFVDFASLGNPDIAAIVAVTIVAVGGVKLGYAYAAAKIMSLAAGLKVEQTVRGTAGCCMLGAGAYIMAKT